MTKSRAKFKRDCNLDRVAVNQAVYSTTVRMLGVLPFLTIQRKSLRVCISVLHSHCSPQIFQSRLYSGFAILFYSLRTTITTPFSRMPVRYKKRIVGLWIREN